MGIKEYFDDIGRGIDETVEDLNRMTEQQKFNMLIACAAVFFTIFAVVKIIYFLDEGLKTCEIRYLNGTIKEKVPYRQAAKEYNNLLKTPTLMSRFPITYFNCTYGDDGT